ncbi:MAG: sulfite exporter TauE/SafE family protein [Desulfuromonadaceae bacterium]|nr:sulfite exporter TauE/SafE family protein [Desulfuromonadaceae bacterium]
MHRWIWRSSNHLLFWLLLDACYVVALFTVPAFRPLPFTTFALAHLAGIAVGTLVMYTGVGAGVVWFPFFTLLGFHPADAASFSLFNQFAGKGSGSFKYVRDGMIDWPVVRRCMPMALLGVSGGYLLGMVLPHRYDPWLLLIFAGVVLYLLLALLWRKLRPPPVGEASLEAPPASRLLVMGSSIFTGMLSVGTSDWLIPHLMRRLRMPASRAVATGIFVMFITALFFWVLISFGVLVGWRDWPANPPLLFGTVPGVMIGAQCGSRLVRFAVMKRAQPAVFMAVLALSCGHMIYEFLRRL